MSCHRRSRSHMLKLLVPMSSATLVSIIFVEFCRVLEIEQSSWVKGHRRSKLHISKLIVLIGSKTLVPIIFFEFCITLEIEQRSRVKGHRRSRSSESKLLLIKIKIIFFKQLLKNGNFFEILKKKL